MVKSLSILSFPDVRLDFSQFLQQFVKRSAYFHNSLSRRRCIDGRLFVIILSLCRNRIYIIGKTNPSRTYSLCR